MTLIALIIVSVIVIRFLYYLMGKFEKYRKLVSIILGGICVTMLVLTHYLYITCNNVQNTKYLTQIIDTIEEDFGIVSSDDVEGKGIDYIVRYLSTNVLTNDEVDSINLKSVDEMFQFAEKYKNTYEVSDWVRCYGKYIGWCLAEHSIDPDADAYWEMKYKSSDKVASYNYGLLVSYKIEGFFIKYAPAIGFYLVSVQMFTYVLWISLTIDNFCNKRRNKSDLQE